MKLVLLFPLVLTLNTTSCVNGQPSPLVAPIVSTLDVTACDVVTIFSGNAIAGEACSAVAGIVNGILSDLMVTADAGPPRVTARKLPTGFLPFKFGGVVVGHVRGDLYQELQARLDALQVDVGPMMGIDGGVL